MFDRRPLLPPLLIRKLLTAAICTTLVLGVAADGFAFGSKKKSPEEEAAENAKKAVKEYNKGVDYMEKARAIGLRKDSTFAYNYRATTSAKTKKEYKDAVKRFKKAVAYNPQFAEAYNNLGYCYRKLDLLEESLNAYDTAISLREDFSQAHEYRGETYLALGELEKAMEELSLLTELESPYADTLTQSIEVFKLNQIDEKLQESKRSPGGD